MKRTRLFLFSLMMLMSFTTVMAQQVSIDEAMSRAKAFMQTSNVRRAPSVNGQTTSQLQLSYTGKSTKGDNVCFYVFNRGTDNGFVIVGGDEVAKEILGYSDTGSFNYTSLPENFKWWLSQYQGQITAAISYAEANPQATSASKAKAKAARKAITKADIAPIVKTQWNQGDPYNSAIPSLGADYTGDYALATGCVATAMAQVMKCFNYPTSGVGSNSYTGINSLTFSADFANTTYDWTNMTNTYNASSTTAQKNAVATLMYHCGVAANMNYGQIISGGSSTSSEKAAAALCNNFKYNNAIRMEYRKYHTDYAWEQMIYNELKKNRPILYGGQSTAGGHAFVCDGYHASDNTYHMNWGWGGAYDCYVTMTGTDAIESGGFGTGGAGAFNQDQDAIINIIASEGGLETPQLLNNTNTITLVDGSEISTYNHTHGTSKTISLKENVWNLSRTLESFTIGIKATNTSTGTSYYFTGNTVNLGYTYLTDITMSFDVNTLPENGTYTIKMVGRNVNATSDDDWYEVGVNSSVAIPTVVVTGATEPTVTKGDATNDGYIGIDDISGVKEFILNGNTTGLNKSAADVNGDNKVDIIDVVKLIDKIKK